MPCTSGSPKETPKKIQFFNVHEFVIKLHIKIHYISNKGQAKDLYFLNERIVVQIWW